MNNPTDKDNPTQFQNGVTSDNEGAVNGDAFAVAAGPEAEGNVTPEANSSAQDQHSQSVYNGRLGAAMRENNSLHKQLGEKDEEIARLKEMLEGKKNTISYDDVEGVDMMDDDSKIAVGGMIGKAYSATRAEIDKLKEEIRQQRASSEQARTAQVFATTQRETEKAVDERWSGLMSRINSGDLSTAWRQFCSGMDPVTGSTWGKSLIDAANRGAVGASVRVFEEFVNSGALNGQFNSGASAPPSSAAPAAPRDGFGSKKVWPSKEAIFDAMEKAQRDERLGVIDRKKREAIMNELEDAVYEGRYAK